MSPPASEPANLDQALDGQAAREASAPVEGESRRTAEWAVLAVALVFPSLSTWLYFVVFAGAKWMMPVYSAGKLLQFGLPVAWAWYTHSLPRAWRGPRVRELAVGGLLGLAICALIAAAHWGFLADSKLGDLLEGRLEQKLEGAGFDTPARFGLMAVFYCLAHSGLEEYYWRWFVFGRLRRWLPLAAAVVVSSLGFMAHHVIVVVTYLGVTPLALGASLGVAVGGALWALLYQRDGSLWGAWLSHLLVDAALMTLGYELLWGVN